MAQHYVYRFSAELKNYRPRIWRLFEIDGEKTMAELGYALMLMFEMQASHLFSFREDRKAEALRILQTMLPAAEARKVWASEASRAMSQYLRYELANPYMEQEDYEQIIPADSIKLQEITDRSSWRLTFEYDYGDGWEVDVTLKKCEKREVSLADLPRVLEGEGFGIIEDVGGVGGLESLAEALRQGSGEQYEEFCDWLDSTTIDLESFDIDDMNYRLKKLLPVYKGIYEQNLAPSDKMLAILLREYLGKGSQGY